MRIAFTTLGCKINQYETEQMQRALLSRGGVVVPFTADADVYIINTCTVTAKSDYQCRQAVRAAVRRGNGARVVVTGCYAETRPEEIRMIPGVDAVVGNREKESLAGLIMPAGSPLTRLPAAVPAGSSVTPSGRTRAFLKMQDGCDGSCSYCIVPRARGRSRSLPEDALVQSFQGLVESGYPEIVLSGIHIGRYGADLAPPTDLSRVLARFLSMRGRARIRLSSIEPREITPEIIGFLGKGLCRHLHIPLQSGDDAILAAMNRDYSSGFYRELIEDIAQRVPGIAIGADVMVGFPGEGETEFENTYRLIQESPLTHLHVFSYSPRPGTPAASMKNHVPEKIKKQRSEALRELGRKKHIAFRVQCTGNPLRTVVEGKEDPRTGLLSGITDNYIRVLIQGLKRQYMGKEITVKIIDSEGDIPHAEMC